MIGVTSQIQSDSGGNDGVGFAVPSNTVSSIASQLISTGKAQHALLGVSVKTASSGGVTVSVVSAGSGAASAGLKVGDVITAVDGTKVTTAEKLRAIIAGDKPGDKITLTITRNGSSQTLTATLGSKTEDRGPRAGRHARAWTVLAGDLKRTKKIPLGRWRFRPPPDQSIRTCVLYDRSGSFDLLALRALRDPQCRRDGLRTARGARDKTPHVA